MFGALLFGRRAIAPAILMAVVKPAMLLSAPVQGEWVCSSCASGKAPPPRRPATTRERFLQRQGLGLARIEDIWQARTPPLLLLAAAACAGAVAAPLAVQAASAGQKLSISMPLPPGGSLRGSVIRSASVPLAPTVTCVLFHRAGAQWGAGV
jgi:hypothetical protein